MAAPNTKPTAATVGGIVVGSGERSTTGGYTRLVVTREAAAESLRRVLPRLDGQERAVVFDAVLRMHGIKPLRASAA